MKKSRTVFSTRWTTHSRIHKKIETATLSVKEEAKLTQMARDLEKTKAAIPYVLFRVIFRCTPSRRLANSKMNREYQALDKKIKEVKTKLDAAKKNQHEIWSKLQPAIDEYDKLKTQLDQTRKAWYELNEESKLEEKKIELLTQNAEEVKKKRDALVNKYYEEEDKYRDQQRFIKHIEWMTRQKERAIQDAEWQRQREEEEKAKVPPHPYMEEIAICDQLIAYCKKFTGAGKKEEEKKESVAAKADTSAIASKISKGELKPMENKKKKEEEGMLVIGGTGKKKGRDRADRKKAKTKPEDARLEVDFGSLALFDKVQVQPPLFVKNVQATLDKLIERKKFYESQPAQEVKKEEAKKPEEKAAAAPAAETKKEAPAAVPAPEPGK